MKRVVKALIVFLVLLHGARLSAQEAPLVIVGKAYCVQRSTVRVKDVLGNGSKLKILSVAMRIGDKVSSGTKLISYEAPMDQVIDEKIKISKHKITANEALLQKAQVELKKSKDAYQETKYMNEYGAASFLEMRQSQDQVNVLEKHIEYLDNMVQSEKAQREQKQEVAASKYGVNISNKTFPKNFYNEAAISGHILYVNPKLIPGAEFTSTDPDILYEVGILEKIVVRCAVHEIQALKLKRGDPVDVVFKAFSDKIFHSIIATISLVSSPSYLQQPSFYDVEIFLDNSNLLIKEGMRCDVTFYPHVLISNHK